MRFMQSADRLFEIVLTVVGIQAPGHLPFPRFFDHQPVKEAREKKLPNNGLNRAAPYPEFAYGPARDVEDSLGGHFRLKYRRHRAHRPGKLIARPLELRRIQPRHLYHRNTHAAIFMHQLRTHRIGKTPNRGLCPAVG